MKSTLTSPNRRLLLGAAFLLGTSSLALTGCGGGGGGGNSNTGGGGGGGCTSPTQYTITDLGTLGDIDYGEADVYGINASGQMVGTMQLASGSLEAFEDSNGKITGLGILPGFTDSESYAINASGQIAGYSDSDGVGHATLFSGGKLTDLGVPPGFNDDRAGAINASGVAVGYADTTTGTHAVLFSGGKVTDMGVRSGFANSIALGINGAGQIALLEVTSGMVGHTFLDSSGKFTDIGMISGFANISPFAINDSGQITGMAFNTGGQSHGFVFESGKLTDLGTLSGTTGSAGLAINASGLVVGTCFTGTSFLSGNTVQSALRFGSLGAIKSVHAQPAQSGQTESAFVFSCGKLLDLNTLIATNSGWNLEIATGVNDSGQIVGNGKLNGVEHAFELTPKP